MLSLHHLLTDVLCHLAFYLIPPVPPLPPLQQAVIKASSLDRSYCKIAHMCSKLDHCPSQQWTLEPHANGLCYITNGAGYVLEQYGDGITRLRFWHTKRGTKEQLWAFKQGFLVSELNGYVLDTKGEEEGDMELIMWPEMEKHSKSQQWQHLDGYLFCMQNPAVVLDYLSPQEKEVMKANKLIVDGYLAQQPAPRIARAAVLSAPQRQQIWAALDVLGHLLSDQPRRDGMIVDTMKLLSSVLDGETGKALPDELAASNLLFKQFSAVQQLQWIHKVRCSNKAEHSLVLANSSLCAHHLSRCVQAVASAVAATDEDGARTAMTRLFTAIHGGSGALGLVDIWYHQQLCHVPVQDDLARALQDARLLAVVIQQVTVRAISALADAAQMMSFVKGCLPAVMASGGEWVALGDAFALNAVTTAQLKDARDFLLSAHRKQQSCEKCLSRAVKDVKGMLHLLAILQTYCGLLEHIPSSQEINSALEEIFLTNRPEDLSFDLLVAQMSQGRWPGMEELGCTAPSVRTVQQPVAQLMILLALATKLLQHALPVLRQTREMLALVAIAPIAEELNSVLKPAVKASKWSIAPQVAPVNLVSLVGRIASTLQAFQSACVQVAACNGKIVVLTLNAQTAAAFAELFASTCSCTATQLIASGLLLPNAKELVKSSVKRKVLEEMEDLHDLVEADWAVSVADIWTNCAFTAHDLMAVFRQHLSSWINGDYANHVEADVVSALLLVEEFISRAVREAGFSGQSGLQSLMTTVQQLLVRSGCSTNPLVQELLFHSSVAHKLQRWQEKHWAVIYEESIVGIVHQFDAKEALREHLHSVSQGHLSTQYGLLDALRRLFADDCLSARLQALCNALGQYLNPTHAQRLKRMLEHTNASRQEIMEVVGCADSRPRIPPSDLSEGLDIPGRSFEYEFAAPNAAVLSNSSADQSAFSAVVEQLEEVKSRLAVLTAALASAPSIAPIVSHKPGKGVKPSHVGKPEAVNLTPVLIQLEEIKGQLHLLLNERRSEGQTHYQPASPSAGRAAADTTPPRVRPSSAGNSRTSHRHSPSPAETGEVRTIRPHSATFTRANRFFNTAEAEVRPTVLCCHVQADLLFSVEGCQGSDISGTRNFLCHKVKARCGKRSYDCRYGAMMTVWWWSAVLANYVTLLHRHCITLQ